MTTANAVTGESGYLLLGDIDTHNGGAHIDKTVLDTPIHIPKRQSEWSNSTIQKLINSKVDGLNKLGRLFEEGGEPLSKRIKRSRNGNIHFIKIGNKIFRVCGRRVSLVNGDRR